MAKNEFELYDRVIVANEIEEVELLEIGDEGIIMSELLEDGSYAVAFNFSIEDAFHDCDGRVPNEQGFYIAATDLKKDIYA